MTAATSWPAKVNLFGVGVSAVQGERACEAIMAAAHARQSAVVSAFSVHALIEAATRPELGAR